MNFYEKPLSELTDEQWEQICLKCGKCCMLKYSDNGVIHFSNRICKYFDLKKGICSCYNKRFELTDSECKKVNLQLLEENLELLPPSCAYRRLYEGKGLPPYHPLLTDNPQSVILAKQTVKALPVHLDGSQEKAVIALLRTAKQQNWSDDRLMQNARKVFEKYDLQWLETYPYPPEKPAT